MVGSTSVLCLRATPGDDTFYQRSEIDCSVLITIQDQTTLGAHEDPFGQAQLGFHHTASRACLRGGEPAVRNNERPAVPNGLVGELAADLTEPGIGYDARQPAVLDHAGDVQVLHNDGAVLAGQSRRELMDRIRSQVRGALMDAVTGRVGFAPAVGCL
jgi:hypothetical protein